MDIHQPDGKELALQIATARNNMPIVKHLVEKYNCDIHVDNETFLRLASFSGYSDLVSYFLNKGANVHARDNASLAGAVYRGNSSVVEILLKAGAPANVHNNLWARYASVRRQDISVLRLLISVGGLSPRFDNDLMLIKGCRNGLMGLLNFLFTDVMAKDAKSMANIKNGVLLEEAIIHKQIHVIQLLLSFGADVYSNGCLNGLYYILHSKITKTTKQIVELLESYGFDVATQDDTFQKLLLQLLYI